MERDLVRWLQHHAPVQPGTLLGIGDDASLHPPFSAGETLTVTTDLLVDGTHFKLGECEPHRIGRKALGVNLSDLAAMAARPVAYWVSLLIPAGVSEAVIQEIYRGMFDMARPYHMTLAGGDTNTGDGRLTISVMALGVIQGEPWTRSGARPGDRILVSGPLGGSILGHHFTFTPRVAESLYLQTKFQIHAAMDISDGLALDLHRMAEASGCGAALELEKVPIAAAAEQMAVTSGKTAIDHALGDGEDFELLLAAPPNVARLMVSAPGLAIQLTDVGQFVEQRGLFSRQADGFLRPLPAFGYLHAGPGGPATESGMKRSVYLASESDMDRLGSILAAELPANSVVGLIGTLGSGKTRLVRAIVAGAGMDASRVQSPTFVLCHEYHGANSVYHLDTYRLKDMAEFLELGAEEILEQPGWKLIEWADRIRSALPIERLEIELEIDTHHSRHATMTGYGQQYSQLVDRVADRYCGEA